MDFEKKNIAILGLGIEGIALAKFFDDQKIDYYILDLLTEEKLRNRAEENSEHELKKLLDKVGDDRKILGDSYLDNLIKYDIIFRSPGIPYLHKKIQEAKKAGIIVSSQIKLFFDLCPAKIIGVTGTKGKGTTSSLIFEMLKEGHEVGTFDNENQNIPDSNNVFLAGNIGKPAISLLDKITNKDWVVLELSSFQLQDLEKSPHVAVVINISVDHLNYHKNEKEYHESKESIVRFQGQDDYAVINQDYLISFEFAALTRAKTYFFSANKSVDEGAYIRASEDKSIKEVVLKYSGKEEIICRSDQVRLVGDHNLANIAAAAITAKIIGIETGTISNVSKKFEGLPHRLELVKTIDGAKFYNDSYATNPEPTLAAINSFDQDKILILGGSSKGADFSDLAKKISLSKTKAVVAIGIEGVKIMQSLKDNNYSGVIVDATKMNIDEIVRESMKFADSEDVVIFSPACASFDMFKDYKDRGCRFKKAVEKLADERN